MCEFVKKKKKTVDKTTSYVLQHKFCLHFTYNKRTFFGRLFLVYFITHSLHRALEVCLFGSLLKPGLRRWFMSSRDPFLGILHRLARI